MLAAIAVPIENKYSPCVTGRCDLPNSVSARSACGGLGRFQIGHTGNFSGRQLQRESIMALKNTVRVVTRGTDGTLRIRDYPNADQLLQTHTQIGIDDCSTDLGLRGLPIFRGLVGPMPEGKNVIRYESPDVFEALTKEWSSAKNARRRRRTAAPEAMAETPPAI